MHRTTSRASRHLLLFVALPILALLAVSTASQLAGIPVDRFTRDPAALAPQHPLSGIVSNLGILLWCICFAVCAFSAHLLARREQRISEKATHLRGAALLTLALLLDDLFMVHDDLSKRYLGFGEPIVYMLLAAAALAYMWRFRKLVLGSEWGLLLFALTCLLSSLGIDLVNNQLLLGLSPWTYFVEDAPKFLGIAAWCGYHYRLALSSLEPADEDFAATQAEDHRQPDDLSSTPGAVA